MAARNTENFIYVREETESLVSFRESLHKNIDICILNNILKKISILYNGKGISNCILTLAEDNTHLK